MSTRISIRARQQTTNAPGFHLYRDCIDELVSVDGAETPVYLRLDGISVQLEASEAGVSVTLTMPPDLARALGLHLNK